MLTFVSSGTAILGIGAAWIGMIGIAAVER
jgi:hypothetical protein